MTKRLGVAALFALLIFPVNGAYAQEQPEEAAPAEDTMEDAILQDGESEPGTPEAGAEAESEGGSLIESFQPAPAQEAAPSTSRVEPGNSRGPENNRWRIRDKQAEGTKAKQRSNKDLVIQSQYELNGRKLEVDPD